MSGLHLGDKWQLDRSFFCVCADNRRHQKMSKAYEYA